MPIRTGHTFDELRHRTGGFPVPITERQQEVIRLVRYLQQQGACIQTSEDVLDAIATCPEEEELSAYRCREGVAVAHASDGWWLLLPEGELKLPSLCSGKLKPGESRDA